MSSIEKKIIIWYKEADYHMPWRETGDPYKIWISEIMLQQTQVNTVLSYYKQWMKILPTIKDVAETNIDTVLRLWQGLGYYRRAHNIHTTSKFIVKEYKGEIPSDYNTLINLKGIGDYTASAILSIAYNARYPAIDGNLKRVISRLKGYSNIKLNKNIKTIILDLMTNEKPGDINQALMDLGREVCTPRQPKCHICPLNYKCVAFQTNKIENFPEKMIKKSKPNFNVIVGVIYKNNKFLISKRKKDGFLGGLWELPGGKKHAKESQINCLKREIYEELDIKIDIGKRIGKIKHHYSHFSINLTGYLCDYKQGLAKPVSSEEIKWITANTIDKFAFPRSTMKLFSLLKENK